MLVPFEHDVLRSGRCCWYTPRGVVRCFLQRNAAAPAATPCWPPLSMVLVLEPATCVTLMFPEVRQAADIVPARAEHLAAEIRIIPGDRHGPRHVRERHGPLGLARAEYRRVAVVHLVGLQRRQALVELRPRLTPQAVFGASQEANRAHTSAIDEHGRTAPRAFTGTVGPAYQFTGVYPKTGEHWANACQTSVPVAFIFKPEYMMQFTNRPIDLLVWYAPKPGATLAIDDVTLDTTHLNTPNELATNFRERIWYQMKLDGTRDRQETFDSVLRPHTPLEDAAPLAKGIRLLLNEGTDRAAVAIETAPGQVRYAGINADGKPLTAGPVQTDAKAFSVTVGPDGAVAHWLVEGTTLNVDGKNAFHAANRKTEHNLAP